MVNKVYIEEKINSINSFKICTMCKEQKQLDDFGILNSSPDKRKCRCRKCTSIKGSLDYQKHKDKRKRQHKEYYEKHREEMLQYSKDWHEENKERITKYRAERRTLPAPFNTYAPQLTVEEDPIEDNGNLMCKCSKCREYFYPTLTTVIQRIRSLRGDQTGESRLYCSDNCKYTCSIFHKQKIWSSPRDIKVVSRCHQVLNKRQLLDLQVDEYGYNFCEKCGNQFDEKDLIIHHNIKVADDPAEADNIAHQILVCKEHHTHESCK